jgi:hypothetical protein
MPHKNMGLFKKKLVPTEKAHTTKEIPMLF